MAEADIAYVATAGAAGLAMAVSAWALLMRGRLNADATMSVELTAKILKDRDELVDLFRDADVMVLPTRGEGYNLPALEAMAAGLPLIVTGHGGHRDFCGPAEGFVDVTLP